MITLSISVSDAQFLTTVVCFFAFIVASTFLGKGWYR